MNTPPLPTSRSSGLKKQSRGFVTLIVSLVILMLSTFVVFNVSKAILMEQKITNNDLRAKQAFEAAEAGMNAALNYLNNDPDTDGDLCIDYFLDSNGDGTLDSNTGVVGSASVTVDFPDSPYPCPVMSTSLNILSTGWSDDRTAMRVISQASITLDPLPNRPDNPVIARGSVTITGSATVENAEGFSTIWSGDTVQLGTGGSAGSDTWVPDPNANGYPACLDIPETCALVKTSLNVGLGLDVIENDDTLGDLTDEQLFMNFFGTTRANYRASMVTMDLTPAQILSANEAASEVIWVEGNVNNFNIVVGCTDDNEATGNNRCSEPKTKPSIIIINGNVTFSGSTQLYGLVYVTGSATIGANASIYGSIVVGGNTVRTGGSLNIFYNSDVLQRTALAGASAGGAGSWKDWQD